MNRQDSLTLANTFAAIANDTTGIGTTRGKTNLVRTNGIRFLTRTELEILPYKDELLASVLHLYPESAVEAWFDLLIAEAKTKKEKKLPSEMLKYLTDLGDREDKTDAEADAEIYGAEEAFLIASILARQFGKAFILMGVDDGKEVWEPVDKKNIASIRWLQVYDCWDLYPEYQGELRRSANYYRLWLQDKPQAKLKSGTLIHHSRLLPFYGARIYSRHKYARQGRRDDGISIIQLMFDAYSDWVQGVKAGSEMLADYDTFTLGMKGLADLVERDRLTNSRQGQDAIAARAVSLDQGKSTVRGLLYDMENELPGSVTRQYSGAKDIMESLERRWIATTRIPKSKLFGVQEGTTGLSNGNTAGLAARSEWALLTQVWSDKNFVRPMERLTKLAFLAKDSPSKGKIPDHYEVVPRFAVPLTDTEKMDYEKLAAERSQTLVSMQAIYPEEVRAGYAGSKFSSAIVLADKNPQTSNGKNDKIEDIPKNGQSSNERRNPENSNNKS